MRLRLIPPILWILALGTPALALDSSAKNWTVLHTAPDAAARRPGRVLMTRGDRFEIATTKGAAGPGVFFRGVNLGAGTPGHFPGEFAATKDDYRRWLRFLRGIHANAVRVYALHPPDFYRALAEENAAHPGDPIWLFQEVWTELPDRNDFWDPDFTAGFENEIRLTIDALHGNAVVHERPGHAAGRYDVDASPWIAGWLLGREWEPYAVRETQQRHPDSTAYHGTYFVVDGGTAMEAWLGRICDTAASYEARRYFLAHAVAFVNWPTLDPMRHPTESERGGVEADHDEDAYSVDPSRIHPSLPTGFMTGFLGYYANYHVYPYYPDFMNLDPGYTSYRDRHGACNYGGYLADLKAHTRDLPLVIGEYGVPTSRGIAHQQPQGINHGGASELEQGARDVRLLEDVVGAGCAGSLLFALFDEWFKVNWLVERNERPRDRDPLWLNRMDAEENYGLLGFDPPPRIRIDGATDDWAGVGPYATGDSTGLQSPEGNSPLRALYVTSDETSLYLRLDLGPPPNPNPARAATAPSRRGGRARRDSKTPPPAPLPLLRAVGVSMDVLDPARGDRKLPAPLHARWSRGAEFVLVIEPPSHVNGDVIFGSGTSATGRAELFVDGAMNYSAFSRRIGANGRMERNRAPFRPTANDDGQYVPLLVETNRERVSRNGKVYPAQYLDMGRLEAAPRRDPSGTERRAQASKEAQPAAADTAYAYDPHLEFAFSSDGRTVEVVIPWGLLNVGDPSSHSILDDRDGTPEVEVSATTGIGVLAWGTTASGFEVDSLGPAAADGPPGAPAAKTYFLGPPGTTQLQQMQELMISTPDRASYWWNGWDQPITRERVKRSAALMKEAFEGMEAREERRNPDGNTHR